MTSAERKPSRSAARATREHRRGRTMLFVLLFLEAPLVPTAALAAAVFVSAISLFDVRGLRDLARMRPRDDLALMLPAAAA